MNAETSPDVASSSSNVNDLARPAANVAPKPKPKPSPRIGRGKPQPRAMGSMHGTYQPALLSLAGVASASFRIHVAPDLFALLFQGAVQDDNSTKRLWLM